MTGVVSLDVMVATRPTSLADLLSQRFTRHRNKCHIIVDTVVQWAKQSQTHSIVRRDSPSYGHCQGETIRVRRLVSLGLQAGDM